MELMFQKYEVTGLERVCEHSAMGEQTADVIVPDSYPDVDRIVDAFGTLVLQDVQSLPDSVAIAGTVQAGVLFVGENGEVHSLPVRIPFAVRKELSAMVEQGIPSYHCELRAVDARTVNSRKLLVRVGFRWGYELYAPGTREISYLDAPSEQFQLRSAEYPLRVPTVTGEKRFTVNEELELPDTVPAVAEILKWGHRLQVLEQKTVGGKGVFKMELLLHLLYEDPQGKLCNYDWRIPVSQFADLSADAEEGELQTLLHITEFDLEPDSQMESRRLFLRVGVLAQCMVYEIRRIKVIEDAYCTDGLLEPQWQQWQYRPLLDSHTLRGNAQWRGEETLGTVVDLWPCSGEEQRERKEDSLSIKIPVACSVIYYDSEGKLRGKQLRPVMEGELPLNENAECSLRDVQCSEVYCNTGSGTVELRVPVQLQVDCFGEQNIRSLQGAELMPLPESTERKPSVILRRTEGEEDLWAIAKSYLTSPKLIREANDLDDGPIPDGKMLLIPLS